MSKGISKKGIKIWLIISIIVCLALLFVFCILGFVGATQPALLITFGAFGVTALASTIVAWIVKLATK